MAMQCTCNLVILLTQQMTDQCSFFVLFSNHLSFSFSFFVHGESSVCTAVEIQQQQRVRHITLEDVAVAGTKQEGLPGNTCTSVV